jgi:antitoxin component YwqK of YwqJK toxin-antitoxin module
MKTRLILLTFAIYSLTSCRFEHKVVEETFPDGSPKRVCIYKGKGEDRELIKETTYYSSNQKQMEGTYKDGLRDGKWMYWYENGNVWSEGFFVKGKSDGLRINYFENGKKRQEGHYKNDARVGKWKFYDENGKVLGENKYPEPGQTTSDQ